jgi:hypothetical protein
LSLRAKSRRRMFFGLTRRREGFYPQIPQIVADYGGLSCRCASSHAAGCFFVSREARRFFYPQIWQLDPTDPPDHAAGFA